MTPCWLKAILTSTAGIMCFVRMYINIVSIIQYRFVDSVLGKSV